MDGMLLFVIRSGHMKHLRQMCQLGAVFFVGLTCCDGCSQRTLPRDVATSAPVVVTLYWPGDPPPDGEIRTSVTGSLMTSSSDRPYEPSQIRWISGTIDDTRVRGFALYEGGSTEQPVFRVLQALSEEDGRSLATFEGESSVEWLLVVEGTDAARIRDTSREGMTPPARFSPGPFTVKAGEEVK